MNVLSSRLDSNISTTTNNFKLLGLLLFIVVLTLLYLSYCYGMVCKKVTRNLC